MANIKAGTPFRAAMLMSMAIATIQSTFARDLVKQQIALGSLAPYQGRGKGGGHNPFSGTNGSRRNNRAAQKRSNVMRHRKACRG